MLREVSTMFREDFCHELHKLAQIKFALFLDFCHGLHRLPLIGFALLIVFF